MKVPAPAPVTASSPATFDRALIVAALVHRRQVRRGTLVPYVTHPFHVAALLARHGEPPPVVLAGLLHDVLEDLEPDDADLQQALRRTFPRGLDGAPPDGPGFGRHFAAWLDGEFGAEVMALVRAVTEARQEPGSRPVPWIERKRASLARFRDPALPAGALALKAADVAHNARSIARDLDQAGPGLMGRFTGTPAETVWYYRSVSAIVDDRLGREHPLAGEAREAVDTLERQLEASR